MATGFYTRSEVLWLRQMDRSAATFHDAYPPSALSNAEGGLASSAEETLPAIARWWDVRLAFERVTVDKRDKAIVELRLAGFTEEEVARAMGTSQPTVNRRFRATLLEVMEELGEAYPDEPKSYAPVCWRCLAPAVRLAEVVAERWTYMGRRRREGLPYQAWIDSRKEVQLYRRGLVREGVIGGVYELLTCQDRRLERPRLIEVLADELKVRTWQRAHELAEDGEETPVAPVVQGVRGGRRSVHAERQTHSCAECLLPSLQPRVLRRP